MPQTEQQPLLVRGKDDETCAGTLHVSIYSARERAIRAAQALALWWALALLSVLIPLAHFILVPLFLLTGPAMAYKRYRAIEVSGRVEGHCPVCRNAIKLKLGPAEKPVLRKYCPACQEPLSCEAATASVAQS
jgi:hypothetical protein